MMAAEQDRTLWVDYDYAVVHVVPNVHLSTFLSLGVVIHARSEGYLDARFNFDRARITAFAPALDLDLLDRYLNAFVAVCKGGPQGGPIGLLPPSERFHWLTAPRSAVLQTSPVHPGRSHDLDSALDKLFTEHCLGC
jgi:hypothetical protein